MLLLDRPILSERTQIEQRLVLERKFAKILPRELLDAKSKGAIARIVAGNCWGLWLAGMQHGASHARLELRMLGYETAKFALVDDNPPSRLQNQRAEAAIWSRANILAGNVADTEWARIQGDLEANVKGDVSRERLVRAIADTLGGDRFINRARAIARTELTAAYNIGRIETYKNNGVEAIRRYCISDERTCEQCGGLNGEVARLDDPIAVARITPPSHTNCRCICSLMLDVRQLAINQKELVEYKEPWMLRDIIEGVLS
jgi:SPP1 gp7 family putative phage head morphogenesis protein